MRSDTSAAIICADKWILDSARATVLSRFLINLRQAGASSTWESADEGSPDFSNVNFRMPTIQSVIGNIGGYLDDGLQDHPQDDDDVAIGETNSGDDACDGHVHEGVYRGTGVVESSDHRILVSGTSNDAV